MQAIELNAVITQNHEIHLKLPDHVTASNEKVIVMYENSLKDSTERLAKKWYLFFASKSVFDDDFLATRDNEAPQEKVSHDDHQHLYEAYMPSLKNS